MGFASGSICVEPRRGTRRRGGRLGAELRPVCAADGLRRGQPSGVADRRGLWAFSARHRCPDGTRRTPTAGIIGVSGIGQNSSVSREPNRSLVSRSPMYVARAGSALVKRCASSPPSQRSSETRSPAGLRDQTRQLPPEVSHRCRVSNAGSRCEHPAAGAVLRDDRAKCGRCGRIGASPVTVDGGPKPLACGDECSPHRHRPGPHNAARLGVGRRSSPLPCLKSRTPAYPDYRR